MRLAFGSAVHRPTAFRRALHAVAAASCLAIWLVGAGVRAQDAPPVASDATDAAPAPDDADSDAPEATNTGTVSEAAERGTRDDGAGAPTQAAPTQAAPTADTSTNAPAANTPSSTAGAADTRSDGAASATPTDELGPKVAVVLVGDPDARLRTWASRVDRALESAFERPFDPMLRAALRGGLGDPEDGFAEVRRERRRLGLSEAEDVPVLVRLGRRAGAAVVAVVRQGTDGPELVMLDVRHASFFEGALVLDDDTSPSRVRRFVGPRARSAARGTAAELPPVTAPPEVTEPTPEEGEEDEPDFFERYWPYGAAVLLLGAFIAVIAATASTDGGDQPVLRFVPGGR